MLHIIYLKINLYNSVKVRNSTHVWNKHINIYSNTIYVYLYKCDNCTTTKPTGIIHWLCDDPEISWDLDFSATQKVQLFELVLGDTDTSNIEENTWLHTTKSQTKSSSSSHKILSKPVYIYTHSGKGPCKTYGFSYYSLVRLTKKAESVLKAPPFWLTKFFDSLRKFQETLEHTQDIPKVSQKSKKEGFPNHKQVASGVGYVPGVCWSVLRDSCFPNRFSRLLPRQIPLLRHPPGIGNRPGMEIMLTTKSAPLNGRK